MEQLHFGTAEHIQAKAKQAAGSRSAQADEHCNADTFHDQLPAIFADKGLFKICLQFGPEAALCRGICACLHNHDNINGQVAFREIDALRAFFRNGHAAGSDVVLAGNNAGKNRIKGHRDKLQPIAVFLCKMLQHFDFIADNSAFLHIAHRLQIRRNRNLECAVFAGQAVVVKGFTRFFAAEPLVLQFLEETAFF